MTRQNEGKNREAKQVLNHLDSSGLTPVGREALDKYAALSLEKLKKQTTLKLCLLLVDPSSVFELIADKGCGIVSLKDHLGDFHYLTVEWQGFASRQKDVDFLVNFLNHRRGKWQLDTGDETQRNVIFTRKDFVHRSQQDNPETIEIGADDEALQLFVCMGTQEPSDAFQLRLITQGMADDLMFNAGELDACRRENEALKDYGKIQGQSMTNLARTNEAQATRIGDLCRQVDDKTSRLASLEKQVGAVGTAVNDRLRTENRGLKDHNQVLMRRLEDAQGRAKSLEEKNIEAGKDLQTSKTLGAELFEEVRFLSQRLKTAIHNLHESQLEAAELRKWKEQRKEADLAAMFGMGPARLQVLDVDVANAWAELVKPVPTTMQPPLGVLAAGTHGVFIPPASEPFLFTPMMAEQRADFPLDHSWPDGSPPRICLDMRLRINGSPCVVVASPRGASIVQLDGTGRTYHERGWKMEGNPLVDTIAQATDFVSFLMFPRPARNPRPKGWVFDESINENLREKVALCTNCPCTQTKWKRGPCNRCGGIMAEVKFIRVGGPKKEDRLAEVTLVAQEVFGKLVAARPVPAREAAPKGSPEDQFRLRPFTEGDWYGLQGCERFEDGSQPLICDAVELRFRGGDPASVIVDKTGIAILVVGDDFTPHEYHTPRLKGETKERLVRRACRAVRILKGNRPDKKKLIMDMGFRLL